jgi:hypothetical protein
VGIIRSPQSTVIEVPAVARARRVRRLLVGCLLVVAGSAMAPATEASGAQAMIVAGPADGADVSDRTPTFEFIAASSSVVSICTIDAGLPFICTSPLTLIALKDGPHRLSIGAVGITDTLAGPAARSFTVDTVAPDTEITAGPSDGSHVSDDKLQFGWTSRDAVGFECQLDRRPVSSCDSALSKLVANGPHRFSVAAFDAAGNVDLTPAWRGFVVVSPYARAQGCRVSATFIRDSNHRGVVTGSAATNILFGRGGDDVLRGLGGRDCLYGGAGSDTVIGGAGDDLLSGGLGADRLIDGRGRDTFIGGVGNDRIDARDLSSAGARRGDVVDCGRGFDRALVDRADHVARSCERVLRRNRR